MDYPKYIKGTRFGLWALYHEKQRNKKVWVIRRKVYLQDRKPFVERLSTRLYRQWRGRPDEADELRKLVIRLNDRLAQEQRVKAVVEIKHAYISPAFLDEYQAQLMQQIPNRNRATTELYYVKTYFLDFFINQLGMKDPLQWHMVQKTKWAEFLLSDKAPKAAYTKRDIVNAVNRFMFYLHEQRPAEVPPLKFQPLTKAVLKNIEAKRILKGEVTERKRIKDEHWETISKNLPANIKPFVLLAYHFGLRRAESQAILPKDIKRGYLSVERQLESCANQRPVYGPLKSREPRKVPYWFVKPAVVCDWVKASKGHVMHPDTLSDHWVTLMKSLGFDYDYHDIRHTFITKAFRVPKIEPRDVQLAAGHEHLETTMGYTHDDRDLDDEVFTPEAS